jgi:hypothetical protein
VKKNHRRAPLSLLAPITGCVEGTDGSERFIHFFFNLRRTDQNVLYCKVE